MTDTPQAKQNEPGQAALDAFNLARIRNAMIEAEQVNEQNNSAKNKLRGVYAITAAQALNNDAARTALKLAKDGDEAIDKFLGDFERIGVYLGYLGKVFTRRQGELSAWEVSVRCRRKSVPRSKVAPRASLWIARKARANPIALILGRSKGRHG